VVVVIKFLKKLISINCCSNSSKVRIENSLRRLEIENARFREEIKRLEDVENALNAEIVELKNSNHNLIIQRNREYAKVLQIELERKRRVDNSVIAVIVGIVIFILYLMIK